MYAFEVGFSVSVILHFTRYRQCLRLYAHRFLLPGNFMWDVDYISKQLYEAPWSPLAIDWISEYANGTYRHYAEPRHATEAITSAAQVRG